MKRFLVNGLCLSRNLGGPAMALTLEAQLRERYPDARFVFAVPAADLDGERRWAATYGLQVVPTPDRLTRLTAGSAPLRLARKLIGRPVDPRMWIEAEREYLAVLAQSQYVITMQGVAYVGDGTRDLRASLSQYSAYHYARRSRKRYCRFVESYGPFADRRIRWIARRELSRLPFIMARGAQSAAACRALLPHAEIHDVPDIAILLEPAGPVDLELEPGGYAVLCPSSVIRELGAQERASTGGRYVDAFVHISEELTRTGNRLLFLPHSDSDREVCREIIARLSSSAAVVLVDQEIDPRQAKWLIDRARHAVVSRYHALVAAASTATPVVAIGWNVKYSDLLAKYGLDDFALDARQHEPDTLSRLTLERISGYDGTIEARVRESQRRNVGQVRAAFERLCRWIDDGA